MNPPIARRRFPRGRAALLAIALAVALPVAGCGASDAPEGTSASGGAPTAVAPERDDSSQVMAAALLRLISEDHTFGEGPHRFTEYLIQSHIDPSAGDPTAPRGHEARALSDAERAAIESVVAPFGPHRFVDDAAEWRTDDLLPKVEGSVILGVGEPTIDGGTALVPVSLWCSGLCGTWLSYRIERVGGTWKATGTEGPVAVS